MPIPSERGPSFSGSATSGQYEDAAGSLSSGLKDAAGSATSAVKRQAAQLMPQLMQSVREELGRTGENQKARGAEVLRGFARAIESAAADLEQQSPAVARTVRGAAAQVEGLSDNLDSHSVNELVDAAARLARRQPALFIGGSVVAGFALARFLQSSARQPSSATSGAMSPPPMNGPMNAAPMGETLEP